MVNSKIDTVEIGRDIMSATDRFDILVYLLGACLLLLIVSVLVIKFFASVYMPFAEERDFIRMEIMRTRGNERIHWEHELRRLYIEQIPFIGIYLAENSRKRAKKRREKNNSRY